MTADFVAFPKVPRYSRDVVITEKIDGTNGQIYIYPASEHVDGWCVRVGDFCVKFGSRSRWVTPEDDNFGFAAWGAENAEALVSILGPGRHFGEWWGRNINRGYGLTTRLFSLFNVDKWFGADLRGVLNVVPVLYRGPHDTGIVDKTLQDLTVRGSLAAPGYPYPEGIIIYHTHGRALFKKTLKDDDHKGT